jgi:hypothetical protein
VPHCASWEKEIVLGAWAQGRDREDREDQWEGEDQLDQHHWELGEEDLDMVSLALVSGSQALVEHAVVADERSHEAHTGSTVVEALGGRGYQPTDDSILQPLPVLVALDLGEVAEGEDPTVEQPVHEWRRAGKPAGEHLVELGRCLGSVHHWMVFHLARAVTGP